jgi:hypothetical protein
MAGAARSANAGRSSPSSSTADFRAIKILLDFLRDIERQNDPASADATEFSAADQMVLEQLKARAAKG